MNEIEKLIELIDINNENKNFLDEENKELIQLLMKVDATDIPLEFVEHFSQVITMLLMLQWINEAEYQHLDRLHSQLKS